MRPAGTSFMLPLMNPSVSARFLPGYGRTISRCVTGTRPLAQSFVFRYVPPLDAVICGGSSEKEHMVYNREVRGSSPRPCTRFENPGVAVFAKHE